VVGEEESSPPHAAMSRTLDRQMARRRIPRMSQNRDPAGHFSRRFLVTRTVG
jgi:hypothetical protein